MNKEMKWIIFAIAVFVAFYALNKLFKGVETVTKTAGTITDNFGITESDKAEALKQLACWSPGYYKGFGSGAKLMTAAGAKTLAQKIYDARTLKIYTDDDAILGAFKQLKAQTQVSFLADIFYKEYGQDLLNYFWIYMQDRIKRQLFDFISSLPKK